jgi:uncharacterized membrane protein YfcA
MSLADPQGLLMLLLGAFAAGFATGFAGFGAALVASGFWFHALPAPMVPPLIAMASVTAHVISMATLRRPIAWRAAAPMLAGGVIGVPLGVLLLLGASPDGLRLAAGIFLLGYPLLQLALAGRLQIGNWGGRPADGLVGLAGGVLGGFAGLSGALPAVWLNLRGGSADRQRAVYQPFNLMALGLAALFMAAGGLVGRETLLIVAFCLPLILFGSWLGARAYIGVSDALFRRLLLALLFTSGLVLVGRSLAG